MIRDECKVVDCPVCYHKFLHCKRQNCFSSKYTLLKRSLYPKSVITALVRKKIHVAFLQYINEVNRLITYLEIIEQVFPEISYKSLFSWFKKIRCIQGKRCACKIAFNLFISIIPSFTRGNGYMFNQTYDLMIKELIFFNHPIFYSHLLLFF